MKVAARRARDLLCVRAYSQTPFLQLHRAARVLVPQSSWKIAAFILEARSYLANIKARPQILAHLDTEAQELLPRGLGFPPG